MRLGVAPHRLWPAHEDEFDGVLEVARTAEELGFDHLIASSHLLAGAEGVTPDPLVPLPSSARISRDGVIMCAATDARGGPWVGPGS